MNRNLRGLFFTIPGIALGIIGDDPKINDRLILAQQAFAAGLLVYGFILGFFSGYLITKLQLGKAIAE